MAESGAMVPAGDFKNSRPGGGQDYKEVASGEIEKGQYVQNMLSVYTTSHYLAVDIEKEIPLFIDKARVRIRSLIEIIAKLKKELYDTKVEVIKVNQRLHTFLRLPEFQENFEGWDEGLEEKLMAAETPDDIAKVMEG
ncbi:hypothetical protein GGTG_11885 [Gaeumannomyces tritici R3-111a-1]|uniref:Uncharacterized protein n=1 Tax=Gaeumannomyces tritici (strain R3-111a-1) TaxID=644352 RepID=J3PEF4_GAET3|nr:hypothetical protein GGTG_11885 [Gaeumannomyces tritici R3-111a-1]EJT70862.1 hypothetical protein GGTG_11885 [Gaeumannomyces tritici R3-111a-1]